MGWIPKTPRPQGVEVMAIDGCKVDDLVTRCTVKLCEFTGLLSGKRTVSELNITIVTG